MNPILTSDLKVKFLGVTPYLKEKNNLLNPQEIVALSSLATFKGKSLKTLLKEIEKRGERVPERIKGILQRSSLRGHASIATTPTLCLFYEGSKFLDSALTGIIFSSSLVSSGRRTETSEKDIVYPLRIFKNKKAKEIYAQASKNIIQTYNYFLSQKIQKDEASKILQYGIYGTGIIQLPIESIVGLKREYLAEKEWMPEEIGILLKKIEEKLKDFGLDLLYATREAAPRSIYPYPNIFKDPKKLNLVREQEKLISGSRIISIETSIHQGLKEKLENLAKKTKEIFFDLERIKKEWPFLLTLRQEILRDYNLALKIKILSSIPWRVWSEKKRHRTCPQIIESIYFSIERTNKKFQKLKRQIEEKKISEKLLEEIEEVLSIPPSIKRNFQYSAQYLLTALKAFLAYQKLIKFGISPREAIFLIPRAVKIDILQEYDLYNLLAGYYPLRLCSTAEEEMRRNTLKEVNQIKKSLEKMGLNWLNKFIVAKCEILGFCPEEKSCSMILNSVKNYEQEFHQEMKEQLKRRFEEKLKNLAR